MTFSKLLIVGLDSAAPALVFDRWRDEGVGTVQVSVDEISEADVEILIDARNRHRGEA